MNNDCIFDGIVEKFLSNIYGIIKGKFRYILLCDVFEFYLIMFVCVIEIGGGIGVMIVYIVFKGYFVVLIDVLKDVFK